jgi:MoCo/4Fe-4S cofactor protein with predicted Tat translocation signal
MKRKFEHPAPSERELTGPRYWRSLDELSQAPGFREALEREFPEGASESNEVDRRQFVKLMAASFALGGIGLAGCRRPEAHILPYSKSVENIVPGLPLYYATAMPARGGSIPLLAETHQGRPTKLEGNPSYAPLGGVSSLTAQASVLDLYDPDRARGSSKDSAELAPAGVNDLLASLHARYSANGGEGLAFLAEESSSPTRAALVAALRRRMPKAVWAEYDAVDASNPRIAATAAAGRPARPYYRFDSATRILSLDADFLQAEPGSLVHARDFARTRRITGDGAMSRLYVAESVFTITGSSADHRLRVASSAIPAFAGAIASRILKSKGAGAEIVAAADNLAAGAGFDEKWLDACASDLVAAGEKALVIAGFGQAPGVHALVLAVNAALGSIGRTVQLRAIDASEAAPIGDLAAKVKAGAVRTLVVLGGNPAYNAPAELDWASLQKSVGEVIRHGYHFDETSAAAGVHIAASHYLESWGDTRTSNGTILAIQPMILPLFPSLSEIEVLARIAGDTATDGYTLVHRTFMARAGAGEAAFRKFLHDGLIEGSSWQRIDTAPRVTAAQIANGVASAAATGASSLEVRFPADVKTDDGRYANNGWLQECPEPMTKISWDNAILVSPRLAKELGIDPKGALLQVARKSAANFKIGKEQAFIGELSVGGRTVRGPIHIQPGLANYTVVAPLGYGRAVTGRVGTGVGFNAYSIRAGTAAFATGATLTVTGDTMLLANTQEHWSMEGREIVREGNLEEFQENPAFARSFGMEAHSPPIYGTDEGMSLADKATLTPRGNSLYETPDFTADQQWGMSIDLNTCIGCNACVVACQAENNIPIVGKDQVLRGREMHWIRLDRYYSDGRIDSGAFGGESNREIPEDPQVAIQPMTCQHCELAPCEMVCPVNATVHDEQGLNVMAYNRCVGTRYCANNCPYKVRRFNFFDWNQRSLDSLYMGPLGPKGMPELLKMAKNPDVTVRMRGVMEKCTFCLQRIEGAKIEAKAKAGASGNTLVADGRIKTACQQVCPAEAIVFGDIKDETTAVSKAKADPRTYEVLGYLNVRPRVTYVARVRNPNKAMPDYGALPLSRVEYNNKNHPAHEEHGAH